MDIGTVLNMDNQSEFEPESSEQATELSSPTSLFDQLALEEPPIDDSDTSPSATAPRLAVNVNDSAGRYLGTTILIASFLLTIAAGLIIFSDQSDDNDPSSDDLQANTQIVDDTTIAVEPTDTQVAQNTDIPTIPAPTANTNSSVSVLSTAAFDEAAISLLTPVPQSTQSSSIIQRPNQPFTERTEGSGGDFVYYTVQDGDTLELISQRYNLEDFCTIVWSNERRFVSPLKPNNQIIIPPVDGVFYKIREPQTINELAETTGVDAFSIIDSPFNPSLDGAIPDSLLLEGMQIMVPSGDGGNCNVWSGKPVAADNGGTSGGSNVSSVVGFYNLWGCEANITGGGFPVQHPLNGGGQFFQGFSAFHSGVDLSASTGTPVAAAGLGTVIFAGRNGTGYGNAVVIAHGTTFTLYGHLSTINVGCGQSVSQGQTIGAVGSTGNSSGPHLHFEIRNANFDALDPCYTIAC